MTGPAAPSPRVHIVILNWNGWQDTIQCLESVMRLEYSNYRIVVVDNASDDGSVGRLRDWVEAKDGRDAVVSLVEAADNLGFCGGCNLGIEWARRNGADYVFLLNNDATVRPDTLGHLLAVSQAEDAAITGARILDDSGGRGFSGSRWPAHVFGLAAAVQPDPQSKSWPSGFAPGCAIMIRGDLLERRLAACGHVLDPIYFMYCEEVDLCRYGIAHGYGCLVARDAVVHHRAGTSSGVRRSYYYLTRNRIILANRWLGRGWKWLFHLYFLPSRLAIMLTRIGRMQTETALATAEGLYHGYRGRGGKWNKHGSVNAKFGEIRGGGR